MSDLQARMTLDAQQFERTLQRTELAARRAGSTINNAVDAGRVANEIRAVSASLTSSQQRVISLARTMGYYVDAMGQVRTVNGAVASSTNVIANRLRQLQISLTAAGHPANALERQLNGLNRSIGNVNSSFSGMGAGGAIASFFGVSELIRASDTWTTLGNRIRLVTESQEEFNLAQSSIVSTALQTGQALDLVATTYQSLARNAKELSLSQGQVLQITNTLSKAMVIGGGSAESNRAALVQLGQAFSSGVLRGEEFNSVMEQAPAVAQTLARGLGVPVSALRKMAEAGELTTDRVTAAFLKMGTSVDEQFKSVNKTISQSLENLKTKLTEFVGQTGEANGSINVLTGAIGLLANNLDKVITVIGLVVGYKVAAWALGAASATTILAASFLTKASAATAAALATNGGAIAMGRAAVAAGAATPAVTSLSAAFTLLTASAARLYASFAPLLAPIAAATSSLIAFDAAMKFKNGEDASNAISNFVEDLLGIDRKVDSLGIKLYDLLHPEESNINSTITQEIRTKATIEIASNSTGLLKELEDAERNFGLTNNQIKINAELLKIEEELKKKSNNEATQESLIRSQNVLIMAKETEQRRIDLERFKKDAEERKQATEDNIKSIKDSIRAKEEEVAQIGKSKAEIEAMKIAAKGATSEQQNYVSSLQKMVDANEEQTKRQKKLTESLADIEKERKTAGMSDADKKLYDLKEQGATASQLSKAKGDLEAAKAIKDAIEKREKADKEHEKEMKKAAKEFASGATKMKDVADKQDPKNMSRYERNNAKWAAIREEERAASMMSVFFGSKKSSSSSASSASLFNAFSSPKGNDQLNTPLPMQQNNNLGTINLNVTNENGITKAFPFLSDIKTLKDLQDFVAAGVDVIINNGAMANA